MEPLFTHVNTNVSMYPRILAVMSTCLSVYPYIYVRMHASLCVWVYVGTSVLKSLSVFEPVRLSFYTPIYLFIFRSTHVCASRQVRGGYGCGSNE